MIETKEEFLHTPIFIGKTEESEEDEIINELKDSTTPINVKQKFLEDSSVSPSKTRTIKFLPEVNLIWRDH